MLLWLNFYYYIFIFLDFLFTPTGLSSWPPSRLGVCSTFLPTGEFFLPTLASCCSGGMTPEQHEAFSVQSALRSLCLWFSTLLAIQSASGPDCRLKNHCLTTMCCSVLIDLWEHLCEDIENTFFDINFLVVGMLCDAVWSEKLPERWEVRSLKVAKLVNCTALNDCER